MPRFACILRLDIKVLWDRFCGFFFLAYRHLQSFRKRYFVMRHSETFFNVAGSFLSAHPSTLRSVVSAWCVPTSCLGRCTLALVAFLEEAAALSPPPGSLLCSPGAQVCGWAPFGPKGRGWPSLWASRFGLGWRETPRLDVCGGSKERVCACDHAGVGKDQLMAAWGALFPCLGWNGRENKHQRAATWKGNPSYLAIYSRGCLHSAARGSESLSNSGSLAKAVQVEAHSSGQDPWRITGFLPRQLPD